MLKGVFDARVFTAGQMKTALAAPLESDGKPRMVGPFAVVAHALPLTIEPGALPPDFDVRPHPHIGLAAVTYMLDGYITHRDSIGSRREIGPGGLAFMVAGRGIVHSERFERLRALGGTLDLLQLLIALPDGSEDVESTFASVEADRIPRFTEGAVTIRWLAGGSADVEAPVRLPAPTVLSDVQILPGQKGHLPSTVGECAAYVISGSVDIDGVRVGAQQVAMLAPGHTAVQASEPTRMLVFGGEPPGPRYMWWNFIHSSLDRMEAAKADWRAGRLALPPGDTESFTPAPQDDGRPLHYFEPTRGMASEP